MKMSIAQTAWGKANSVIPKSRDSLVGTTLLHYSTQAKIVTGIVAFAASFPDKGKLNWCVEAPEDFVDV